MSGIYNLAREKFLNGQLNWGTITLRAALVDTGVYTPNFDTDAFMSSVAAGAIARSGDLTTSSALGVADATDATFTAVTGATCEAVVLYAFITNDAASIPIALIDQTSNASLPVTPNGGDITVVWNASGIFKL